MMSGLQKILTVTIQQAAKCLRLGSYEIIARRVRQSALAVIVASGFNTVLVAQSYSPPANHRVDINLDAGWKFIRQDVAGAQNAGFDDSSWTNLDLPHTWNNLDGQDGGNNYYRGIGWYRIHYTTDGSYTNRHFFVKFDGAFSVAEVYVNGNYLGQHQGGFAAFVFDVTPYVNVGADNVIAVKVNNAFNANIPPLTADFTFFGGLYRDVHLLVTDPVQISPSDFGSSGIYLKTTSVSSNSASLQVTAVVSNATLSAQTVTVRTVITDAATNIVTILTNVVVLPATSVSNVVANTVIASPHLWDGVADPYLYQTFTEIYADTNLTDVVSQSLGFRWFNVDPTNGFFLNGRHYDLHGVSMHQDWLDRGWAIGGPERAANFALLKEIGATALRLSHYQHDEETYRLADRNGIILWSEIPLINYITESPAFYASARQQMTEMIRQKYNHPAIVCWGLFNEITLSSGPVTTNLVSQLAQLVAQEDSTRPSTAAANSSDNDPTTTYSQLLAFNKYFGWYNGAVGDFGPWADNIHANYPDRCIGVSEYGAGANIYQHGENPVTEPANAGPYHPEEYQNLYHESHWLQMKARPYLWCKFIWNLFDFAADGRSEGGITGRNDKGLITYDRQIRKDAFYWYKANWTTDPMVYITGHTFTNRLTNAITAKVYANCNSVELLVNGASLGSVANTNCIFTWPVALQPGTNVVQAIGTRGATNVSDSLVWLIPIPPPSASIINPALPTVYLNDTNVTLALSASATDNQPNSAPALTTSWSQVGGPGAVTFGDTNALNTAVNFSTNGVYSLAFQAIKGATTTSVGLTVVVGDVPYGPNLKLRYAFDDTGSGTTTPSDTSNGGADVTLQMISKTGGVTNLHGSAKSGVAGLTTGSRALNLSSNLTQGVSGNFVAITNVGLGFGNVTNFAVTMWFKQSAMLAGNIGPRMFILGNSTNTDCGTPNSIGMKFQDASNLWFFVNTLQATASFTPPLPANTWLFIAMVYDGGKVALYQGTDVMPAGLVSTTTTTGQIVPLGNAASLFLGNRPARDRDFAGWIDDFRIYTGAGDLSFVEALRQASAGPAGLTGTAGSHLVGLTWNALPGATSYNLKRSTVSGGPYTTISAPASVTGTDYLDTTVANGTTYYYVVSAATAISKAGETANSPTEVGVTPVLGPPPAPTANYNSPMYAGMTLYLTASTIPGVAYNWTGPNGFTSTNRTPIILNADQNATGLYSVTASADGFTSSPGMIAVTVNPPVACTARIVSGSFILTWPFGLLQSATNIPGPWSNVAGALSPFTNHPSQPEQFYRILLQ